MALQTRKRNSLNANPKLSHGGSKKSSDLAQEASMLEIKLQELRRVMEKERSWRDSKMSNNSKLSMWENGASGMLRSNSKSKPSAAAGGNPEQPVQDGSKLQPAASQGINDTPDSILDSNQHSTPVKLRASHAFHGSSVPRSTDVQRPVTNQQRSSMSEDRSDSRNASDQQKTQQKTHSLLGGSFDEDDSHASFIEALNAWRNAGQSSTAAATTSSHASQSGTATAPSPSSLGMQTEHVSRPSSAKVPYFTKLFFSMAAKQAGQTAGLEMSTNPLEPPTTPAAGDAFSPNPSTSQIAVPSNNSQPCQHAALYEEGTDTGADDVGEEEVSSSFKAKVMDSIRKLEHLEDEIREQGAEMEAKVDAGPQLPLEVCTQRVAYGLTSGIRLPDSIVLPSM